MKPSHFDEIMDRRHTGCRKWDHVKQVFGAEDILPLWIADMDFAAPPCVVQAIQAKANHPIYGYHTREESLFDAVTQWLLRRHHWQVQRQWVLNAPGVIPSIVVAIRALTKPGDGIIIQPPVYPPFFSCVTQNGRRLVENPLRCVNGRYEIDFADLEQKLTPDVKMLILCSPHNPVGRVWSRQELLQLSRLCLQHNVIVISDEIHSDLIFSGHKHLPFASLNSETAAITITCISPSKTFNIAGLYTSMVIISNPDLRKKFRNWMDALEMGKGHIFGFTAAEAAYRTGEDWLNELLPYLEANADFLNEFLQRNLPQIHAAKPEGTYLCWLDFRSLFTAAAPLQKFLVERAKVGLNDGASFGHQGIGFARLNFACPHSLLQQALQQIERAVAIL